MLQRAADKQAWKKQVAEDRRKVGRFCNGRSGGPRCQQRANGPKAPAALGASAQELRAPRPASAANAVNGHAAPSIKQGQHIG
jgi:hypothetical protein